MPNFRIIPTTPSNHATIRQIAHDTWPDTFGDILSPEQITYMLEMMYSIPAIEDQVGKGHVFKLLLEAVDTPSSEKHYVNHGGARYRHVGYTSYQIDYLPSTTKIHKIYLLPETQGRGYGKALIQHVEQISRSAGQQILRLDVNYENEAIGFYEYLGFVKIARYNADIGNGYLMEDWQMEKELV
jgi:ribosomal protein S18 acetylase RimI-like enzyme